ncbi:MULTISPECIES: class I SAM-dependent methyltransferase [Streptomyces]|uniref:class I SAM-dependent methyltransferase n=1 Tax=Streptomyces TaxID=1883 RepID=UPI0034000B1B
MPYEPSETWQLLRILPPSEIRPTDSFADIGCGKGRVLIAAARHYTVRRVIGVEFSADMHHSASDNIARMRPGRSPIELVHSDACTWPIPPDATVFYLFNPFTGETFRRFAANLLASQQEHPRHLRIVYVFPVMHDYLIALGFTLVRTRRNQALYTRPPTV